MYFFTIASASASRPCRTSQRGDSGAPKRSSMTRAVGTALVTRIHFQAPGPMSRMKYPTMTEARKPIRQIAARLPSNGPRNRFGSISDR